MSIGSNIAREYHIQQAMLELRARWPDVRFSPVYESAAVGFAGEAFYNLAAAFEARESLAEVLEVLRQLEQAHGRTRGGGKFAARTLDLDLVAWGDQVITTPEVSLPRAEILEYDFVLRPLAELAPEARHPLCGETYAELWRAYTGPASILRVVPL
nr:2-amino-4-hydroxy-6-hydroxymethyldihydropteridine diphosphokinase [Halorhodospira abdelmalekii]